MYQPYLNSRNFLRNPTATVLVLDFPLLIPVYPNFAVLTTTVVQASDSLTASM